MILEATGDAPEGASSNAAWPVLGDKARAFRNACARGARDAFARFRALPDLHPVFGNDATDKTRVRCQIDAMAATESGRWLLELLPVFAAADKASTGRQAV